MNDRSRKGIEILSAALVLGVVADIMLRRTPWGLNILIFVASVAAAFILFRKRTSTLKSSTIALCVALLFFATMFTWRDAEQLLVLDWFAMLTIFAALSLSAIKIEVTAAGVLHFILGFVWSGLSSVFGPAFILLGDIDWDSVEKPGWKSIVLPILRGVAVASPLLLIFGALFVSADAAFEGAVDRVLNLPGIDTVIEHSFFIVFFSWIGAGYLRGSNAQYFPARPGAASDSIDDDSVVGAVKSSIGSARSRFDWMNLDNSFLPRPLTLGAIEIGVVLGLIDALFLVFVLFQLPYLFGGFEFVQSTPDFKLSDYARRGFGELVAVAFIVLPVLLSSHWLLRRETPKAEKIFRVLAGIQTALLFVIMSSAMQRLMLLTGNLGYGWTTTRFYPMVFMLWLAVVFVWFVLTVLRGRREKFAWAALWSAFVFLGALHFVNPDRFIVESNIRLMNEGREFDAMYNSRLSDDAIPPLVSALPSMSAERQCVVKTHLSERLMKREREIDVLNFNFSRSEAINSLRVNREALNLDGCPHHP